MSGCSGPRPSLMLCTDPFGKGCRAVVVEKHGAMAHPLGPAIMISGDSKIEGRCPGCNARYTFEWRGIPVQGILTSGQTL